MPQATPRARPTVDGILRSAERVFTERGYGATPLRDLIRACGCSTTAFYARFDSKEAVLESLARRLFRDLHTAAVEALPLARDVEHGYELGIEALCGQLRGRKGLWRLVLTEGAHTPRTRPVVRDAYDVLAKLLASQLAPFDAQSEARAWAIIGTLSMHLTRWAVFEQLTEAQTKHALRATAALLLPPSAGR